MMSVGHQYPINYVNIQVLFADIVANKKPRGWYEVTKSVWFITFFYSHKS